ncbi:hypothetical protein VSDG_02210 [Cytospora chrysosperma]|uniref:Uncharacterized protein n=1 Tax=Cytospora chrysosperma TaxID=252740 RepID=A0A423WE14_CYTCH|nr:hypothetical protein VSDG_02210 [Valsa sordida]
MSNDNDPSSPSSRLSSKARLAYYLTGGTRRGPGTMTSLLRLARDRNDAGRGHKAWEAARDEDLARHQDRWGQSGLAGRLEEARGLGPKPRGQALVRWYREEGRGGPGGGQAVAVAAMSADRPVQPVPAREQQAEQPPEDDIYGASDEEQ